MHQHFKSCQIFCFSGRWKHAFFFTSPSNSRPNKRIPLHLFLSSKTLIMGIFVLIYFLDICNLISLQQEDDTCSQESTSKAYYNQITSAKRQTLLDFMTGWLQGAVSVFLSFPQITLYYFWKLFSEYFLQNIIQNEIYMSLISKFCSIVRVLFSHTEALNRS